MEYDNVVFVPYYIFRIIFPNLFLYLLRDSVLITTKLTAKIPKGLKIPRAGTKGGTGRKNGERQGPAGLKEV